MLNRVASLRDLLPGQVGPRERLVGRGVRNRILFGQVAFERVTSETLGVGRLAFFDRQPGEHDSARPSRALTDKLRMIGSASSHSFVACCQVAFVGENAASLVSALAVVYF